MWSRGLAPLRGGWITPNRRFSVPAQAGSAGIEDFLTNVATAASPASAKTVGDRKIFETEREFSIWLDKNPVKSVKQFLRAAQMVTCVRVPERPAIATKIDKLAKKHLVPLYGKFAAHETIEALRLVLQLSPMSTVSKDMQRMFLKMEISDEDLKSVSFETLVMIVRYADASVEQAVIKKIVESLTNRIPQELEKTSDLLALLAGKGYESSNWFHNKKFLMKAEQLVQVMGTGEKCALLKHMADLKQRDRQLLGKLVQSLSGSSQVLTVSQIVSVVSSCCTLTWYPPSMLKKIAEDLSKNANVLDKWNDVISMSDSFVRMRMGDEQTWKLLVKWAVEHSKEAKTSQLARFVTGLARIGEFSGKPLAAALKPLLKREKVKTPSVWLNIVHSLAYFEELDAVHADSVLNKSFVAQIMNSSHEMHDRLQKAQMLLMVSASANAGKYDGPTVSKETFSRFGINFDAKTIANARKLKYSNSQSECDELFLKSLFKLAPQDTHCRAPSIEECGAFVDAYVMPEPKTGLLVGTNKWGSNVKPRPLFFNGWLQTKLSSDTAEESQLMGKEQMALRLMRAEGFDPIVVFKKELEYCSTDIDRVNLLRDKIHKKID